MTERLAAKAVDVEVTEVALTVNLADGRSVSVPTAWYPRLLHGTSKELGNWRIVAGGDGINWPDLDEDISVDNLLDGKRSGESQRSLKKWMADR
jgi:hypothetical protein